MTLRFRLALVYTLIAFVLLAVVGIGGVFLLTRALDQQFEQRLDDQAAYVAALFQSPDALLGQPRPSGGALVLVVDSQGNPIYQSPALQGTPPLSSGGQEIGGVSVRSAVSPLEFGGVRYGQVWVALPDESLQAAKLSAWQLLGAALLLAPLLMLVVGWFVGRSMLRDLAGAARVAERLDPSAGSIPLPQRQDEVYRLLEAINRLLARIEAQKQREKTLLGQIVHELGAPLTAIRMHLERAEARTGDPEVGKAALVADELSFTTQDLMQLARGNVDMRLALHYLNADALRARLDRLVPGVNYSGDWNAMVLCDPDRLVQALRNLLANARRAAGPDGQVELNLHDTPEEVRFAVRDTGPGLPEGLGERIFEPFISGSGSSGLGLSVSRQIAELHGGRLTARNHEEGGAEFRLVLPGAFVGEDEEDTDPSDLDHGDAEPEATTAREPAPPEQDPNRPGRRSPT